MTRQTRHERSTPSLATEKPIQGHHREGPQKGQGQGPGEEGGLKGSTRSPGPAAFPPPCCSRREARYAGG